MWPFKKKQKPVEVKISVGTEECFDSIHCVAQAILKELRESDFSTWIHELSRTYTAKSIYDKYSPPSRKYTLFADLSDDNLKYVSLLDPSVDFQEEDRKQIWDILKERDRKKWLLKLKEGKERTNQRLKEIFPQCFPEENQPEI